MIRWPDQSRLTAQGAVRTRRLSEEIRADLRQLVADVLDGAVSDAEFSRRWSLLDLAPAEGLPHLEQLSQGYIVHTGPETPTSVPAPGPNVPGPNQMRGLLEIYWAELHTRDPAAENLPLPASSPSLDARDLPVPH
jgi:hypothetical protein